MENALEKEQLRLATKSLVTLFARLINLVLAVAGSIFLARFLGPENRGVYAVLILVVSITSLLGNMGLGTSNVYFLSKGKRLQSVLFNSLLVAFLIGGTLILLAVPFLTIISDFAGGSVALWLVLALVVTIPFRIASMYVINLFLGLDKIGTYNIMSISSGFFSFVPLVIFLYVLQENLTGALLAYIAGSFINFLIPSSWILVRRYSPTRPSFDWGLLKESLLFGIKGHLGNIAGFLNYRMDIFLVAYFVGASGVGLYSVAVGVGEIVGILPSAMALVLLPKVASSGTNASWAFAAISCRNIILLTVLVTLLIAALGGSIINVAYGSDYSPAYPALIALLPAMVALGIDRVLSSYIIGSGKPIIATYAISVATIANLILNIVFIPLWGITGAAAASSVSYTISAILVVAYSLKLADGKLSDIIFPKLSDITIYRLMVRSILRG